MKKNHLQEYNRQIQNLLEKGYHHTAGMSEGELLKKVAPLQAKIVSLDLPAPDFEKGYLPFVIVVSSSLMPTTQAMSLVEKDGQTGITKLFPHQPTDFSTIPEVKVPATDFYLLIDIDRGQENINQPPSAAMEKIRAAGRSPLTIDEGVALVTHYPEFLRKNNCFSLLGSRHPGDQRVPAIWINGTKNPNLGWCWNGNPHTWLGSASCTDRFVDGT